MHKYKYNIQSLAYITFLMICFVFPSITHAVTGEVQFDISSQYRIGTAGSYASNGNTIAKLFDGNFLTNWDAPTANGGYAGLDLTVPAHVTRVRIAPRVGYTYRLPGTLIQGSNTSSTTGPWTTLYTVPSSPYSPEKQYNEFAINTGTSSYRYYTIVPPNAAYGSIGEVRFIGVATGTTPYLPVTPTVTPAGGQYSRPIMVSLSSLTTDATLYYTTDGTTPVFSGGVPQGTTQLYTNSFLLSTTGTTTIRTIAVSGSTTVSEVSDYYYFNINSSFVPGARWSDTNNMQIDAYNGGISFFNGKYYWYGESLNNTANEAEFVGVNAYSSTDLLNWRKEGLIINSITYKIKNPHVIYNATTSTYVLWARNSSNQRAVVATSSSPAGPFVIVANNYVIDGSGANDITIFKDTDGTAYAVYTRVDNSGMNITKLSSDYLTVLGSGTMISPSVLGNRGSPSVFKRGNVYFLMTAGVTGYTPSMNKYSTSTSPLGTWSTLVNPFQTSVVEDNSLAYRSQTSDIINISGRNDGYVYYGDRYNSATTSESRALWLPIVFPTSGSMSISYQSSWDIDSTFSSNSLPVGSSNLTVSKVGLQSNLSWVNNETNQYTTFVDRATDAAFTINFNSTLVANATTTWSDLNITNGDTYYYRIRTVTGAGTSNSSSATGDFSLSADITPPEVTVISPNAGALLIGHSITLSATSTDDISVSSVQFYVDGVAVGTIGVTPNHSVVWDSATVVDGIHSITAVARDPAGNSGTSSPVSVTVGNSLITFSMSTTTVMQTSIGNTVVLTGVNTPWTVGTPGTPTFTLTGGTGASIVSQTITSSTSATLILNAGTATGTLSIRDPESSASSTLTVVADNIPPTVSITSPTASSTLVGHTITLTATSSDNVRIVSVQFVIDNTNIGISGTSSPYSIIWDSATVIDGNHTLVAVVTDAAGNVSTSTSVSVVINNSTLPTIVTASSTSIGSFTVTLNGLVTADGGASSTVRGFVYGLTTSYTATTTETGSFGVGTFSTSTISFACATTYHYKAYTRNLSGIVYGLDQTFTTAICPVSTATGEIQFSSNPAYQFGLTPSYLNLGNVPSKVFDGDLTTWWDTQSANGAYVGLDLSVPAQATRFKIAPRPGYTVRVYGAKFQGAATSSASGPWTTIYTIPSFPPYYAQRQLNEISVDTGGQSYRYYRLLMPDGTNGTLAEFRIIGLPGTATPFVPATPTISPNGGRFEQNMKVRISSLTSNAALYYTTDGSAPSFIGGTQQGTTQLYTGPFVVTGSATTTVKAIAVSGGMFVSEISDSAQFYIDSNYKPSQDWLDTSGRLIESHDGSTLYADGKYYWYGQIFNANDPENEAVGVSCYSSSDLLNWKDEGPILYLGRTTIIERPHVVYNPTTHKYVMWGHNVINYPNSRAFIAYSDTPTGTFTVASSTYNPDGSGLNDMNLFVDTDGTGYVIYSNGTNLSFIISRLSSDYLTTSGTYIVVANHVNREAPAMFKRDGIYYLMSSGITGWGANLNKYATSTSVLGSWSTPLSPFVSNSEQNYLTSYDSQVTDVFKIQGREDSWVYVGDRFNSSQYLAGSLYLSRHIWLPLIFESATSTKYTIPWQSSWNLDTAFPNITTPTLLATNFIVNKIGSSVTMSWTNNETNSYSLYVDRATDINFTQNVVSDLVSSTSTSYTDVDNVGVSSNYYYRIRTVTGAGTSNSATQYTNIAIVQTVSTDVSSVPVSTTGNTVYLTGLNTSWTVGTPGTPTFTLTGGTGASIVSQTITSSTSATLILNAGTATGTLVIIDSSTSASTSIVVSVVPDTTAPTITLTATSTTQTTALITFTTNEPATSTISYGTTTSYGSSSLITTATTTHSYTLTNLTASTTYHHQLSSTDTSNNTSTSSDLTFTTAVTPVVALSSLTSTTSANSIHITWNTNIPATSNVYYGLMYGLYTNTTTEYDISEKVLNHSALIYGLSSCTPYKYIVVSQDLTSATSSEQYVSTSGCTYDSPTANSTTTAIQSTTGGSTVLTPSTGNNISVNIPTEFTSTSSEVLFVIQDLDAQTFFASAQTIANLIQVGSTVVNLTAHTDIQTIMTTFDKPIVVTMSYKNQDIYNTDENSLKIYRYDNNIWTPLDECIIDKVVNTVTCQTNHFSDFSIFGSVIATSPVSYGSVWSQPTFVGSGFDVYAFTTPKTSYVPNVTSSKKNNLVPPSNKFTRSLIIGSTGKDVQILQKFLNANNFYVADKGVGSKGKETTIFGKATKLAVISFQNAYSDIILKPQGLKVGTGKVGEGTYRFINSLKTSIK